MPVIKDSGFSNPDPFNSRNGPKKEDKRPGTPLPVRPKPLPTTKRSLSDPGKVAKQIGIAPVDVTAEEQQREKLEFRETHHAVTSSGHYDLYQPVEMTLEDAHKLLLERKENEVGVFIINNGYIKFVQMSRKLIEPNKKEQIDFHDPVIVFPEFFEGLINFYRQKGVALVKHDEGKHFANVQKRHLVLEERELLAKEQNEKNIISLKQHVWHLLSADPKDFVNIQRACSIFANEALKARYPHDTFRIKYVNLSAIRDSFFVHYTLGNDPVEHKLEFNMDRVKHWIYKSPGAFEPLDISKEEAYRILETVGDGGVGFGLFRLTEDGSKVVYDSFVEKGENGRRETRPLSKKEVPKRIVEFELGRVKTITTEAAHKILESQKRAAIEAQEKRRIAAQDREMQAKQKKFKQDELVRIISVKENVLRVMKKDFQQAAQLYVQEVGKNGNPHPDVEKVQRGEIEQWLHQKPAPPSLRKR